MFWYNMYLIFQLYIQHYVIKFVSDLLGFPPFFFYIESRNWYYTLTNIAEK